MTAVMSTEQYKGSRWADLGLFYAAAIWGTTFFIVKDALAQVDPIALVAYRFLIAGAVLLAYCLFTRRPLRPALWPGTVLGIIIFFLYVPQTVGLSFTTASNSGFITGMFVAFVPLFMYTIFRRKPSWLDIAASAVALAGLWILTGGMHDVNTGDLLTVVAAVTYALHVLYSDHYMKADIDPYVLACLQFLIVGVMSVAACLILGKPFAVGTWEVGGVILFLALFPTLSAFLIQLLAQRVTAPVKVSLIFSLEPVFAAAFAWTIGGEAVVLHRALGGLVIFAALVLASFSSPGKVKEPLRAT